MVVDESYLDVGYQRSSRVEHGLFIDHPEVCVRTGCKSLVDDDSSGFCTRHLWQMRGDPS